MECAKKGCLKETITGWKYCSRECAPYGTYGLSKAELKNPDRPKKPIKSAVVKVESGPKPRQVRPKPSLYGPGSAFVTETPAGLQLRLKREERERKRK